MTFGSYKAFLDATRSRLVDGRDDARRKSVEEMVRMDSGSAVSIHSNFKAFEENDDRAKQHLKQHDRSLSRPHLYAAEAA